MPTIWRLHTVTGGGDIAQYCLENHVAAMGWSLFDCPDGTKLDSLTFEDYCRLANAYESYRVNPSVRMLAEDVKENDILWMHVGNSFYMARVKSTSHWVFNHDFTAVQLDACNQLTDIDWKFVGSRSEVPGALSTAFMRGTTFRRVYDSEVCEFSERICSQKDSKGFTTDAAKGSDAAKEVAQEETSDAPPVSNTTVWRLHTITGGGHVAQYCLDNHVAAMGWSLFDCPDGTKLDSLTFEDYCRLANAYESYKVNSNVRRLAEDVKENDILWMRKDGVYYMARVKDTSHWVFNHDPAAVEQDVCNQLTDIEWERMGDESDVPGAVSTAFIMGTTFTRINKPGVREYSECAYDKKHPEGFHYGTRLELEQGLFYSLLSPGDCEDLLAMWLYSTSGKNYTCIPSTDKQTTAKYECVLLDTETGNHIYIQVKNGETCLNTDDYAITLEGTSNEFYLLTTRGEVENEGKHPRVHVVSPDVLFDFARDKNNQNVLPPNVRQWIEFTE